MFESFVPRSKYQMSENIYSWIRAKPNIQDYRLVFLQLTDDSPLWSNAIGMLKKKKATRPYIIYSAPMFSLGGSPNPMSIHTGQKRKHLQFLFLALGKFVEMVTNLATKVHKVSVIYTVPHFGFWSGKIIILHFSLQYKFASATTWPSENVWVRSAKKTKIAIKLMVYWSKKTSFPCVWYLRETLVYLVLLQKLNLSHSACNWYPTTSFILENIDQHVSNFLQAQFGLISNYLK